MRTNLMIRDMDVPAPNALDGRRLEVVVDGLPVRGGAQVAIDTTMVCALHRDGTPRERKERTYPELLGPRGRAQLVVVALEVGGRWSEETRGFCERRMRWSGMLAYTAARAVASSLARLTALPRR